MAKAKTSSESDCDTALLKLIDHVSPASVCLTKPKYAVIDQRRGIELTVITREAPIVFAAETIAAVAAEALDGLDAPREDPFVPAWSRLARIQRQVVVQTPREHSARHMAQVARAKLGNSGAAFAEYQIADAFSAAVDALDHEDVDEHNEVLKRERLAADQEPIPGTGSRRTKKSSGVEPAAATPRG